jgi:hypothetical protein
MQIVRAPLILANFMVYAVIVRHPTKEKPFVNHPV